MEIEYLDSEARRAATAPGSSPSTWTESEVMRLRLVVQCVRAALVITDLLKLQCLQLRAEDLDDPGNPGDPDNPGRYTTTLSPRRRLTLTFKADSSPITAMLDIVLIRTDRRK